MSAEEQARQSIALAEQAALFDTVISTFLHGSAEEAAEIGLLLSTVAHTEMQLASVFCRFAVVAATDLKQIAGPEIDQLRAKHQGFFAVDSEAHLGDNETIVNQLVATACNDDVPYLLDQALAITRLGLERATTILAVLAAMTRQQHRSFRVGQNA